MTRPQQSRQRDAQPVSPFHWREFTEGDAGPGRSASKRQRAASNRPASARDLAERILAHRWSGAYSKAGPV